MDGLRIPFFVGLSILDLILLVLLLENPLLLGHGLVLHAVLEGYKNVRLTVSVLLF
jgi:hypothetical protein